RRQERLEALPERIGDERVHGAASFGSGKTPGSPRSSWRAHSLILSERPYGRRPTRGQYPGDPPLRAEGGAGGVPEAAPLTLFGVAGLLLATGNVARRRRRE